MIVTLKAWTERQIHHLYYLRMNNRSRFNRTIPVDTHAEVQDNTLQPESQEMEDNGVQPVDPTNVQNQDVEENVESVEVDASEQQVQAVNTDSQVE